MSHPTDIQLAAWVDTGRPDDATAAHVRDCHECAALTAGVEPGWELPPVVGPALALPLPRPIDASPARGQVWRLRWDATSLLAVLWTIDDDYLTAIPLTPDVSMADDHTVCLAEDETGDLGPMAVWVGLESPIAWHVLDVCWGQVPVEGVALVRQLLRARKPVDLVEPPVGSRIVNAFDERYEYRSLLGDAMNRLGEARWVPEQGDGTLEDLALAADTDLSAVLATLGAPATERLRFKRGQRPLTNPEAHQVAPLLRVDPETVMRTNPPIPVELVAALDRPRWRPALTKAARQAGQAERDQRLQTAYAVLGLAARQSAFDDAEAQWHERLKHHFAT